MSSLPPVKYIRKVIRIKADDSPNVRVALAQQAAGKTPTNVSVVPGVISWQEYQQRRRLWDPIRQCVGLDGQFYEGAETLLYPPQWLNESERVAAKIKITEHKQGKAIGVDTAEGGDDTTWMVTSEEGILRRKTMKTPDTSIITGITIGLMQEYGVKPNNVMFDSGGGGKEHADRLISQGYKVRMTSFGESTLPDAVRHRKLFDAKIEEKKERYTFKNRRAQMYWMLRLRLDPINNDAPFAIPAEFTELRRQLSVMPMMYDEEGKIFLPPKRKKPGVLSTSNRQVSIEEMLGCSPDEADALVLACYAMDPGSGRITISAVV